MSTKKRLLHVLLLSMLGLISSLSTGCTMYLRVGQQPPAKTALVPQEQPETKPQDGTYKVLCDEYVPPDLPTLPGRPYMSEKEMKDAKAVADMLLSYMGKFLETVNERDKVRKDYYDGYRKTCRTVLVDNKTLPD